MKKAIYPGSFDPPTLGHIDIIQRASGLVNELVVAIGVNSDKKSFLSVEDRKELLQKSTAHLPNVTVTSFSGVLVEFAQAVNCNILIRGLRAVSDFEYEFRVAMANRRLAPDIETLFLITRDEYSFLSSTVVREVAQLGGDTSQFVPPLVTAKILERISTR